MAGRQRAEQRAESEGWRGECALGTGPENLKSGGTLTCRRRLRRRRWPHSGPRRAVSLVRRPSVGVGVTGVGGGFTRTCTAEAAKCIPHSYPRMRSCEGERRTQSKTPGVCPSGWREAPAAEPLGAWHVSRPEVGAGGRPRGSDDPGGCAKAAGFSQVGIYRNQER